MVKSNRRKVYDLDYFGKGGTERRKQTVREVMYERIMDVLSKENLSMDRIGELTQELADIAFSTCGIPEREQKENW